MLFEVHNDVYDLFLKKFPDFDFYSKHPAVNTDRLGVS